MGLVCRNIRVLVIVGKTVSQVIFRCPRIDYLYGKTLVDVVQRMRLYVGYPVSVGV